MKLSAIIPTHGRPQALSRCLETLARQHVETHRLEVLVIDDGSEFDIAAIVDRIAGTTNHRLRSERQPPSGLNAARNRGARVAEGDILAYLDDDTLVSPQWARAILDAFERYPCAGLGGRTELLLAGPAPDWLAPRRYYLAEYDLGTEDRWLDGDPVPVGANCAVRRSELGRIGGFRADLDRAAGSLVSNGDTEFFRRLRSAGGRLRYEPQAHVLHCVPADRLTVGFFVRRHFAQGLSDELMHAVEAPASRPYRAWRVAADLLRELEPTASTVLRDIARGRGLTNARFFSSYWRGRFSGVGRQP